MHLIAPTATIQVPDWVAYPDRDWIQITPAEAGLDARKFAAWLDSLDVRGASFGGEDHSGNQYERWDWLAGGAVKERKYLYPTIPDAYTYLDPPYEIGGQVVRSGPGSVVISASDLARCGKAL